MNEEYLSQFLSTPPGPFAKRSQGIRSYLACNIFSYLAIASGFLLRNPVDGMLSVLIAVIWAASLIIIVASGKNSLKSKIFCQCIMFAELYFAFLLLGVILSRMGGYGFWALLLLCPSLLTGVGYWRFIMKKLRSPAHSGKKKIDPQFLSSIAAAAGTMGIFLAKQLSNHIGQQTVLLIVLLCLTFLTSIFALCASSQIVKYYLLCRMEDH